MLAIQSFLWAFRYFSYDLNQTNIEYIFILAAQLKAKYGKDFEKIVTGAIGMITYFDRPNAGLQQLMAGARKFALKHITRADLLL